MISFGLFGYKEGSDGSPGTSYEVQAIHWSKTTSIFWFFYVSGDPFHFNWGPMLYFLHSHLILQLSD